MAVTAGELAKIIDGQVEGAASVVLHGLASLAEAQGDQLSFLANPKYAHQMAETQAGAVIVNQRYRGQTKATLIRCQNPDAAFARIAGLFAPAGPADLPGVHPSAVVTKGVRLGAKVSIGALVFVDEGVEIGDGTVIRPGAYVGRGAKIGRHCLIYSNVTLREYTVLGDRVIIHAGSVIGADGFGYTVVDGRSVKIPQIGHVVIEDDAELGANVTVDRARFGATVIGRGVKIDNLVQIAHNVRIGEGSIIVALCAIAGSTTLGKGCVLGGQVAIDGHLTIGDNVRIAAKSGVTKSWPANSVISGFPAQDHRDDLRQIARLRKLAEAAGDRSEIGG